MPRRNEVWFRKDTGWWMVTLAGKKVRLAEGRKNRKLAEQKFHELKAVAPVSPAEASSRVCDVVESFLEVNRPRLSPETMRNYGWYGQAFSERWGYVPARDLQPHHVTTWVTEKGWTGTTEFNARRSVFRVFSWAKEEGLLVRNPLAGMKRPKPAPRSRAMTNAEFRALLRAERNPRFRTFLYTLHATGCRPKEARVLTWEQVREDRWVLAQHKTSHKTKKPRVVYLSRPMRNLMSLLRRRRDQVPARLKGCVVSKERDARHVFVNAYGKPWTTNAVRLRIARLKSAARLSPDVCAYLLRHSFGTQAIVNGVDVATVAELMGHSSLEMVSSVYLHLADQHKHLQDAAEAATRPPASAKPPPGVSDRAV